MRAGGGGPFGGGEDELERVLGPRSAGLDVGDAAPQVDHPAAVDVQAHRRANVSVFDEVVGERMTHRLEPGLHEPLDVDLLRIRHGHEV